MLNAFSDLLCSKLCWHNRLVPSYKCIPSLLSNYVANYINNAIAKVATLYMHALISISTLVIIKFYEAF